MIGNSWGQNGTLVTTVTTDVLKDLANRPPPPPPKKKKKKKKEKKKKLIRLILNNFRCHLFHDKINFTFPLLLMNDLRSTEDHSLTDGEE